MVTAEPQLNVPVAAATPNHQLGGQRFTEHVALLVTGSSWQGYNVDPGKQLFSPQMPCGSHYTKRSSMASNLLFPLLLRCGRNSSKIRGPAAGTEALERRCTSLGAQSDNGNKNMTVVGTLVPRDG